MPDLTTLEKTPAKTVKGEPVLCHDARLTNTISATHMAMKQTGAAANGNTFEVCTPPESEDKDDILVTPAFGIGGQQVRRQIQDLVVLHYNKRIDETETPFCFVVKDAARGTNYYQILKDEPVRSGQGASSYIVLAWRSYCCLPLDTLGHNAYT